jgi:hypothetical protein
LEAVVVASSLVEDAVASSLEEVVVSSSVEVEDSKSSWCMVEEVGEESSSGKELWY